MTKSNGNTLSYRVDRLEKEVGGLNERVEELMTNHIPHLSEQIARLETRIVMFTAINVGTVIIAILLHEIL